MNQAQRHPNGRRCTSSLRAQPTQSGTQGGQAWKVLSKFNEVITLARERRWRLWDGDVQDQVANYEDLAKLICHELGIRAPTVIYDPEVDSLGVYDRDVMTIRITTNGNAEKLNILAALHQLAHHCCHQLGIPYAEERARAIALRAFFAVWPKQIVRRDIPRREYAPSL